MCKGKWSKYFKHYGVPDKPYGKGRKGNKHLTESMGFSDVIDLQQMMSTESTLSNEQVRGPEAKQGPDSSDAAFVDTDAPEPSMPHSGASLKQLFAC